MVWKKPHYAFKQIFKVENFSVKFDHVRETCSSLFNSKTKPREAFDLIQIFVEGAFSHNNLTVCS